MLSKIWEGVKKWRVEEKMYDVRRYLRWLASVLFRQSASAVLTLNLKPLWGVLSPLPPPNFHGNPVLSVRNTVIPTLLTPFIQLPYISHLPAHTHHISPFNTQIQAHTHTRTRTHPTIVPCLTIVTITLILKFLDEKLVKRVSVKPRTLWSTWCIKDSRSH